MGNHRNIVGTMVFCLSCKSVVWAYDSGNWGDVRGVLNAMQMPCRLCGSQGNFDQFDLPADRTKGDTWQAMRKLGEAQGMTWRNSGDLTWFSQGVRNSIRTQIELAIVEEALS